MSNLSYDSENELLVVEDEIDPYTTITTFSRPELERRVNASEATAVNATAEKKIWEERLAEFDKQAELNPKPKPKPKPEPVDNPL